MREEIWYYNNPWTCLFFHTVYLINRVFLSPCKGVSILVQRNSLNHTEDIGRVEFSRSVIAKQKFLNIFSSFIIFLLFQVSFTIFFMVKYIIIKFYVKPTVYRQFYIKYCIKRNVTDDLLLKILVIPKYLMIQSKVETFYINLVLKRWQFDNLNNWYNSRVPEFSLSE